MVARPTLARMSTLRERIRAREPVLGTFVKTASHQVVEVLGINGMEFVIVDAEHAPFDLGTLDAMVLAGRAVDMPVLVRVPELAAVPIGQTLDLGAAGVVIPHVYTGERAQASVNAAKYTAGQRGFSPSTRAGRYGTLDHAAYRAQADADSIVWCQIEDREAIQNLDDIAAVDAVDCLFIGRADLSLSLGVAPKDPAVAAAVKATADAGLRHNRTIGIHISDTAEIPELLAIGITAFVYGHDQGFIAAQTKRIKADLAQILKDRCAQ
jgi:2-keto-3-deoxy-L-rhamnonate aldolase RhmA